MTVASILAMLRESLIVKWAATAFGLLFGLLGILLVILGALFILKRIFKGDPEITRAYRATIYLVHMGAIVLLAVGGLLSLLIPVIPGWLLIIFALLLLQKYHKSQWVESKLQYLRLKRKVKAKRKRAAVKFRKTKVGKALRKGLKKRK